MEYVGGIWDKGNSLWIVINGIGYNAHLNKNKKLSKHPDYVITKAKEKTD
jgi:hypothetical protein